MEIKHNSVQIEIPEPFRSKILQFSKDLIDPSEIVELETNPHITVIYGLENEDLDIVKNIVNYTIKTPLRVEFGITRMFIADDLNENDVLFLEVKCPDLVGLHYALKVNTAKSYSSPYHNYYPHLTLAKLLPYRAMTYVGESNFLNEEILVENIVFSTPTKEKIQICRNM